VNLGTHTLTRRDGGDRLSLGQIRCLTSLKQSQVKVYEMGHCAVYKSVFSTLNSRLE